eukprot:TRINITY_DN474_c0_g1_i1.p1 TRINITY_DN474_c0_g1~~TRINITY_DN474_c0_g1_i1.p1  ORF type:complete len:212 (-),score=22.29 TRINITY_DN474_c0_g1_i1:18-653(-)
MKKTATATPTFKCLLIGDGNVGKSTFVRRHRSGDFTTEYVPTLGVEVHPLRFHSGHGPISFKVWDTAGQEKFGGLRDGYYMNGNCAIIMFDLGDRKTYSRIWSWKQDIERLCPNIPIVVVGNKFDLLGRKRVPEALIKKVTEKGMDFVAVSSRTNYNLEKPFLLLSRKVTGEEDLVFVAEPSVPPPEETNGDNGNHPYFPSNERLPGDEDD